MYWLDSILKKGKLQKEFRNRLQEYCEQEFHNWKNTNARQLTDEEALRLYPGIPASNLLDILKKLEDVNGKKKTTKNNRQ